MRYNHYMLLYSLVLTFACLLSGVAKGDGLLDSLNKGVENIGKSVKDLTNSGRGIELGVCLTNNGCDKGFFYLQNYCCGMQCCDWFTYVFRDNDKVWENFKTTIENPRANNIVIFVLGVIVLSLLISALASLISHFLCGCSGLCCCCGSRKYTIVSRG